MFRQDAEKEQTIKRALPLKGIITANKKQFSMVPDIAVILTDASRHIIWVNRDFTKITGYSLGDVAGKKPSLLQGPRSERTAIERIRQNLHDQISFKDEITNYRKNGEAYLCKLVVHPIFNGDNQLSNFIAFEVDGDRVKDEDKLPLMKVENRYHSSSLRGVDGTQLYAQLKYILDSEKLYLNPNLSLRELADLLGTNTKYLSQVVNHIAGYNFQRFINLYRIRDVKAKMQDPTLDHLTLFGVARQCGFKNKSTFYKVFKDITNMTPRNYLSSILTNTDQPQS